MFDWYLDIKKWQSKLDDPNGYHSKMIQISSLVKKWKHNCSLTDEGNLDEWIEKWDYHQKQVEMLVYSKIKRYWDLVGTYVDSLPDDMNVDLKRDKLTEFRRNNPDEVIKKDIIGKLDETINELTKNI